MITRRAGGTDEGYEIEAILLPPGSTDHGLAIGVDPDRRRVVGWGSRSGPVPAVAGRSMVGQHAACLACTLALPTAAIGERISNLTGAVAISADGVLGEISRRVLGSPPVSDDYSSPDLIVVSGEEPSAWLPALRRLATEGTLLVLMSPFAAPMDFDFYSQVHVRSLRLQLVPWYLPPVNDGDRARWHELALGVSDLVSRATGSIRDWRWVVGPSSTA